MANIKKTGANKKPPGEKKVSIRTFIEGHKIESIGGVSVCQKACFDFLTDKAKEIEKQKTIKGLKK